MTFTAYPFENQDTTETQYQRIMGTVSRPGVMGAPGTTAMQASDAGGLNIRLAAGNVFCRGMVLENDGADPDAVVRVADVHAQSRVGRLVARFDPGTNTAFPFVLLSAPGSSVYPLPVKSATGGIYDVKLCRFSIPAGAPGFTVGGIVSEREWVSVPVERWTQEQRNDMVPGSYQTGHNLSSSRMEFYDPIAGTWRYLLDTRDAATLPWTQVPLAGGVGPFYGGAVNTAGQGTAANHPGLAVIRHGNTVWIAGAVATTSGNAFTGGQLLGVLPPEYRPSVRVDLATSHGSQVAVNPENGDLRLSAPTLTPAAIITASWPVGV